MECNIMQPNALECFAIPWKKMRCNAKQCNAIQCKPQSNAHASMCMDMRMHINVIIYHTFCAGVISAKGIFPNSCISQCSRCIAFPSDERGGPGGQRPPGWKQAPPQVDAIKCNALRNDAMQRNAMWISIIICYAYMYASMYMDTRMHINVIIYNAICAGGESLPNFSASQYIDSACAYGCRCVCICVCPCAYACVCVFLYVCVCMCIAMCECIHYGSVCVWVYVCEATWSSTTPYVRTMLATLWAQIEKVSQFLVHRSTVSALQ